MKTLKIYFFFFFTILACQQTHSFLFKDTTKLWSKLLKLDDGSADAPEPVSKENFFSVFKDTKEKLFKEIPKTIKTMFHKFQDKIENKVEKIEKEKEEFDEKLVKVFKDKKRVKNILDDFIEEKIEKIEDEFIDKKLIEKPVVKVLPAKAAPMPKEYKPKEKIIKVPPKYALKSVEVEEPSIEEVYVKPKPYLPPKYLPKSVEAVEPSSEEAYVKPKPYAAPYPCSEELIPEPILVRLKATVPENAYYFT